MSLLVLIAGGLAIALASYVFGYAVGRARGVADGWLQCYFAGYDRDKAQRNADGTFKSKRRLAA